MAGVSPMLPEDAELPPAAPRESKIFLFRRDFLMGLDTNERGDSSFSYQSDPTVSMSAGSCQRDNSSPRFPHTARDFG